ncbi:MAG: WYL domain-containing protein [Candidatus Velthaea sp.]|jgi:predicted DNA-binding transcriptional regulator YafY
MQSQRLLSCLLLLQGKRRVTARELARQLEVSMRTIYRDVEALCAAGVPIHMERGPLGGIVLADDYRRALAHFTNDELQALFASGPGPMTDLGSAAQSQALQKLAGALPAAARQAMETGRARLLLDHNRWSRGEQPTDVLVRLRRAVQNDRSVRLEYRDRGGTPSERRVDPLGLVAKAGVWYLIGREPDKGYRTFRAQRIVEVEELPATFSRPPDFDLEAYWNASVTSIERQSQETYDVVLRVERDAGPRFIFWDVTVLREDEQFSTLRVAFPSRELAIATVLVYADALQIVSPDDLPSAIVERARVALATFDRPADAMRLDTPPRDALF